MAATHARNVALTPQLSSFVDELVTSGEYANASEVLREGLRVLKERRETRALELAEIRQRIALGLNQLDKGDGVTLTPDALVSGLMEKARSKRVTSV
jgi:putative addiction module CopG family antidote